MLNKVKEGASAILVSAVVLVFAACPYESQVPLNDPASGIKDDALLGTWVTTEKRVTGLDSVLLDFSYGNPGGYKIVHRVKNNNPSDSLWDTFEYNMHITELGGKKVLNVREISDSAKYRFFLYELRDSTLRLSAASDAVLKKKIKSSGELSQYFLKNIGLKNFTEEERILTRRRSGS